MPTRHVGPDAGLHSRDAHPLPRRCAGALGGHAAAAPAGLRRRRDHARPGGGAGHAAFCARPGPLCTLRLARDLRPGLENHRLETLAPALDVRNPAPHRALGDVFTTLWTTLALLEAHAGPRPAAQHVREAMRAADGRRLNPWA
jgi:hypothetical protein